MQPNQQFEQPPAQPQSSIDYLNQISAPQKVNTVNPIVLWGAIGGLVLVVLLALFAMMGSSEKGPNIQKVAQRIQHLRQTSEDQQENIYDSKLRSYNVALSVSLKDSEREAFGLLDKKEAKKLEKDKKSPIVAEYADLNAEFDDARLNNIFDRVYSREMTYHISILRRDLEHIKPKKTSSPVYKFATSASADLKTIQDQFGNFKSN